MWTAYPPPPPPYMPHAEIMSNFAAAADVPQSVINRYSTTVRLLEHIIGGGGVRNVTYAIVSSPDQDHSSVRTLLDSVGYEGDMFAPCCLCGVGLHNHVCIVTKTWTENPFDENDAYDRSYFYSTAHEYMHAWQRTFFMLRVGTSCSMNAYAPQWWLEGLANVFGYQFLEDHDVLLGIPHRDYLFDKATADYAFDINSCVESYATRHSCAGDWVVTQDLYVAWLMHTRGVGPAVLGLAHEWSASSVTACDNGSYWKPGFEKVIGVSPDESYTQFAAWRNSHDGVLNLQPRWYDALELFEYSSLPLGHYNATRVSMLATHYSPLQPNTSNATNTTSQFDYAMHSSSTHHTLVSAATAASTAAILCCMVSLVYVRHKRKQSRPVARAVAPPAEATPFNEKAL